MDAGGSIGSDSIPTQQMSAAGYYIATESTRGKNTRVEVTSAKVRKGQVKKAGAIVRAIIVDEKHSHKIDRAEAQRNARRAKRNK